MLKNSLICEKQKGEQEGNFFGTPLFSHFTLVLIFKRINLNVCSAKLNTRNLFRRQCEKHPRDNVVGEKKLRRSHLRAKLCEIEIYNDEILWWEVYCLQGAFSSPSSILSFDVSLRRINCIKEPFATLLFHHQIAVANSSEDVKTKQMKKFHFFIIRPRFFLFEKGWKLWRG
jgi:hypothetical protein